MSLSNCRKIVAGVGPSTGSGTGEGKGSELVELSENSSGSCPFGRLRDRELALRQAQGP
ncbi:MAG: hypothetical protein ACKO16_07090 [Gemmataceae bacterium]